MGFTAGIIGLPNVGKSTIFNALAGGKAAMGAYPFTTVDPNRGVVVVPDPRLHRIAAILGKSNPIPTHIEFFDVAGLVRGASHGEGLGNTFLGHIRGVDALIHVVRCFESAEALHVMSSLDPARDVEIIRTELLLADQQLLERDQARVEKRAQGGDREAAVRVQTLAAMIEHLNRGEALTRFPVSETSRAIVAEYGLITAKPVLYVANLGEDGGAPALVDPLRRQAQAEGAGVVAITGKLEEEISELPAADKAEYLAAMGLEHSVEAAYRLLDLLTFYTITTDLQAWTVRRGATAPQAAGRIHSDFERGFIRAEVFRCEELFAAGDEHKVREQGHLRAEGRSYEIQDGDVVHFLFHT
jgi:GTP-binding protein YchF